MLQALALRDRSQSAIVTAHIGGCQVIPTKMLRPVARRKDMTVEGTSARLGASWADDALELRVEVDQEGVARLSCLSARGSDGVSAVSDEERLSSIEPRAMGPPLLDVVVAGSGRNWSGRRYSESVVGGRMRYVGSSEQDVGA